ncbi:hypothetical protein MXB_1989 [Myxobolus squamalis]|nr:hypothetical protein MXB_1989 [Myxobolus squamalis]
MSVQIGSEYWLIAIKTTNKKKSIDDCKLTIKGWADVCPFNIPDLKIGTLDSLMALSDELVKHDAYIETVTKRISRLILENSNNEMDKVAESLRIHDRFIIPFYRRFDK